MAKLQDINIGDLVIVNHSESDHHKKQGEVTYIMPKGRDYLNDRKTDVPVVEVKLETGEKDKWGNRIYTTEWVSPINLEIVFRLF